MILLCDKREDARDVSSAGRGVEVVGSRDCRERATWAGGISMAVIDWCESGWCVGRR